MRASQTVHSQLPTRSDRIDSLPFGREHRKLLVGSGVGWALDAMDVGLISYVMAALVAEWSLSNTQASWLGSIGFVGMMIGASVVGLLADKWGAPQCFCTHAADLRHCDGCRGVFRRLSDAAYFALHCGCGSRCGIAGRVDAGL